MTTDTLIERLRALARAEHDDLSIGDEAADEIERLRGADAMPLCFPWCVVDPNGKVEISSNWVTEDDAWRIRLGWPTRGEVREAKLNGWRCIRVAITPYRL